MSGGDTGGENEARDMLAAELVLGLLSDAERRRCLAEAASDPALAAAIAAWSVRLEPLADHVPPAAPGAGLWDRIARDIGAAPPPVRDSRIWQIAAAAGFVAAAAALGLLLLLGPRGFRPPPGHPAPAAVPPTPTVQPASPRPLAKPAQTPPVAEPAHAPSPPEKPRATPQPATPATVAAVPPPAPAASRPLALALLAASAGAPPDAKAIVSRGTVRIEMLHPVPLPPDREMALWVWPRGEREPILLGAVHPEGGALRLPYAIEDGTPVMITAETRGLPATGQPGPTLLQGQLALSE